MDFGIVAPIAAFIGIAVFVLALYNMFFPSKNRAVERLEEIRDPTLRNRDKQAGGVGDLMSKAAPTLSKALEPKSELEQNDLRVRLSNAGYTSPNAPQFFLAVKVSCLIGGLLLGGGYGIITSGIKDSWMSLVIGGGFGFYLPELVLTIMKMSRQSKIFLQLPDALDLLVVCVEAGLGLDSGMRKVAEELKETAPEVCAELSAANQQLQLGRPRREVLHDMGVRTGVDDVRALSAILIQADKFGSSIAQALRVQSDSMRIKRRQIAEEKAAKTAVQMIFPLVLFIFPGIFVVLVGPAAIMMINNLLKT